jgi:uncharacterized protein YwgA
MNPNLTLRIRDVALCLSIAKERQIYLNKIQLQKLIYLLDCLEAFFYISLLNDSHQTYYHGPYDKNIQNAADILVFRKMAEAHNIKFLDNKSITCEYEITDNGVRWVSYILSSDKNSMHRLKIVESLINSLTSRNLLKDIVKLVYAEPIFVRNKRNGYGVSLDFENLDENDVFSFMTVVLDAFELNKSSNKIPFISDLLIDFLSKRMIAIASNTEEV